MTPLLNDAGIRPTSEVLESFLGPAYSAYEQMCKFLGSPDYDCVLEWNYYKDGKSWLCKISRKKKTVCWLSVWDTYFKTGFYFSEKNVEDILALPVSEKIREDFLQHKPVGKLLPLAIEVHSTDQIRDFFIIAEYKIRQK